MKIAEKRIASIANPSDRPSDPFRCPGDQHEFRTGLLRMPKFPPTSPETTRTVSFATPSAPAMSSRCRITPPPALV